MATTIEPTTLQAAVRKLALARSAEAAVKSALQVKRDAFAAENAALIATEKEAKAAVAQGEADVKALAGVMYNANPANTKPAPGVEVKLFSEYTIDETAGLAWAKTTGLCLIPEQLDVAALKKVAAATPLPFVQVSKVPRVQIATDLEKALAVADVSAPAAPAVTEPAAAAPEPTKPRRARKPAPAPVAADDEDPFA